MHHVPEVAQLAARLTFSVLRLYALYGNGVQVAVWKVDVQSRFQTSVSSERHRPVFEDAVFYGLSVQRVGQVRHHLIKEGDVRSLHPWAEFQDVEREVRQSAVAQRLQLLVVLLFLGGKLRPWELEEYQA